MSREGSHSFHRAASGDLAVVHSVCEFVPPTGRCSGLASLAAELQQLECDATMTPARIDEFSDFDEEIEEWDIGRLSRHPREGQAMYGLTFPPSYEWRGCLP